MKMLDAGCLCGAVTLSLPDRFDYMGYCHCSECRKFSGADYASVGGLDGSLVRITRGENAIARFQKSPETSLAFCRHCGSSLFSEKRSSGKLNLRLGILNEAPSQRPGFHLFVGSKAPWHEITDELPQFETRLPPESAPKTSPSATFFPAPPVNFPPWVNFSIKAVRIGLSLLPACHPRRKNAGISGH